MTTFKMGYAQAVITPTLAAPVFLAGFGRNRRAESIHDDLYTRVLALATGDELVVIAAIDIIGLDRGQCLAIGQRVADALPGAKTLVACTHTHHGPDTLGLWGHDEVTSGVDQAYLARLVETAAQTSIAAATDLQEASLAAAAVVVPGLAKNLRDPAIIDEELTCLQFRRVEDDRPLATWLVFPCHPEVLGNQNPHMTSDYLHMLRRYIERDTGAPCLVHVGALGGMMTPDVVEHSFAEADGMGRMLAQAALYTLAGERSRAVKHFRYQRQSVSVTMENPLFEMAVSLGLLPPRKQPDGRVLTEASLLRLNDVWLFAVPGELLPALGLRYRALLREAGARVTAIIGLANDELGYILPQEDFQPPLDYYNPGSRYEESMSIGPQMGPSLSQALQVLLASPPNP